MPEQLNHDASAVLSAWITAFNIRDVDGICSLYAEDAVLWGTFSSSLITTPQKVREYFARAFEPAIQARMELQDFHLQSVGSAHVASGSYLLQANIAGRLQSLPARFTLVLARSGESWAIVNHHSSLMPA